MRARRARSLHKSEVESEHHILDKVVAHENNHDSPGVGDRFFARVFLRVIGAKTHQ